MRSEMNMLVLTSCTAKKAVRHDRQLTLNDFRDPSRLAVRENELGPYRVPAAELYTGNQHAYLMDGVRQLRRRDSHDAVALHIISAGYGLVPENRLLAPYNATFKEIKGKPERRDWARYLNIPRDVRCVVAGFPLVIFLLGADYLEAIEPPLTAAVGQRLIFLAKPDFVQRLTAPGVTIVQADKAALGKYGGGKIALKGRMFELFARGMVRNGSHLLTDVYHDDSPEAFTSVIELGAGDD